jgi:5-methyltetrahydrofolate--homocysteine methyltransferase
VVSELLGEKRDAIVQRTRQEYLTIREERSTARASANRVSLTDARANKHALEFADYTPPRPQFLGVKVFDDYDTAELIDYIDWTPFFQTWAISGVYPRLLHDELVREAARNLYSDAREMLEKIVDQRWFTARAVVGFWPANSAGDDDIEVYADDARSEVYRTIHTLRQQIVRRRDRPNSALADFLAPRESGVADFIGGFTVSTGFGVDSVAKRFEQQNDDYNAIMAKALADRLAEAFSERMHERVRREFWGYATDESLDNDTLIRE